MKDENMGFSPPSHYESKKFRVLEVIIELVL